MWRCYLSYCPRYSPHPCIWPNNAPTKSTSREMFLQVTMTRMLRLHLQGGRGWITQSKQKLTDSCEKVTMILLSNLRIHLSVYLLYSYRTKRDVTAWWLTLGFLLSNSFRDPIWIVWSRIHMQIMSSVLWILWYR